jgi:hypothetical protein
VEALLKLKVLDPAVGSGHFFLAASPYRIDVVVFNLETRHGLWVAQVPGKPKGISKKKRTFGTPTFQHFAEAEGRFVDLLPVKDAGEEGAGTLN